MPVNVPVYVSISGERRHLAPGPGGLVLLHTDRARRRVLLGLPRLRPVRSGYGSARGWWRWPSQHGGAGRYTYVCACVLHTCIGMSVTGIEQRLAQLEQRSAEASAAGTQELRSRQAALEQQQAPSSRGLTGHEGARA